MGITVDESVLSGQPRIAGTRIGVIHVYETVVPNGVSVPAAADAFDVSVGEIHEALAYYYNHPDVVADHRERQQRARSELQERAVKPPADPLTE
jgi:uncharacterized protein (DUF433 family)